MKGDPQLEVRTATYGPGIDQSQHAKSVSHIIKLIKTTNETLTSGFYFFYFNQEKANGETEKERQIISTSKHNGIEQKLLLHFQTTFGYDSHVWSNKNTVNPAGAAGGLSEQETKLHTYHTFRFSRLCIGLKTGGFTGWQKLDIAANSLYSLIRSNVYHKTSIGRHAWKKLIPGSSLQRNCNMEGINDHISNSNGPAKVRIGIIANQENECKSPDSRIGIGGAGHWCGQDNSNSVGNTARCHPDNGDRNIKSFGYVFAALRPIEELSGSLHNPGLSCKDIKAKNG